MEEKKLLAAIKRLIRKYEDGNNHNAGAFDDDCPLCVILQKLRAIANGPTGND